MTRSFDLIPGQARNDKNSNKGILSRVGKNSFTGMTGICVITIPYLNNQTSIKTAGKKSK